MKRPPALVSPGEPLGSTQRSRYSRQLLLPGFGEVAQRRMRAARVLVIGAGGLGSASIPYLAAAGVGTIGVVDDDTVELSNLHRQITHGMSDIGRSKVDSIANSVHEVNPEVTVVKHSLRLTSDSIMALLSDYDIVLDGSDNFPTRYLSNDAATLAHKPLVWGAILRYGGQASVSWSDYGPTYRDLFPSPPAPDDVVSCEAGGVLPGVCASIGAIMATETMKIVTGIGQPLIGRVTTYDALSGTFREIPYRPVEDAKPITHLTDYDPFCQVPAATAISPQSDLSIDVHELAESFHDGDKFQLIDVRQPEEADIAQIESAVLIPLGLLSSSLDRVRSDIPVVVYCHLDVRSQQAVRVLRTNGRTNIRFLRGGIDAYARNIDPTLTRY